MYSMLSYLTGVRCLCVKKARRALDFTRLHRWSKGWQSLPLTECLTAASGGETLYIVTPWNAPDNPLVLSNFPKSIDLDTVRFLCIQCQNDIGSDEIVDEDELEPDQAFSMFGEPQSKEERLQQLRGAKHALAHQQEETQRLLQEPAPGISATPYEDNLRYFNVICAGPTDSPYEGGVFNLELFLPEDYPMAPPKVRFITKIYHPNIDRLGRICLDILKDKWSPALQIRTVLLSIQALLSAPNPDDPLNNEAAELWKSREAEAIKIAKEFTMKYAVV